MARTSVVQDIQRERSALSDTLRSGAQGGANNRYAQGTDIPGVLAADPATRQLMQESVYTRAYGTGKPMFSTAPTTPSPRPPSSNATFGNTPNTAGPRPGIAPGLETPADSGYRYAGGQSSAFDETKLREQSMTDLQRSIDAIKAKYTGTLQEAGRQGEGRLGQQRGLSTISGTRFSPRGGAEQTGVENANAQVITAINADMNAEIAQAEAAARGDLMTEIRYRGTEAATAAQNQMQNTLAERQLQATIENSRANQAISRAGLTGMFGGESTMAMRQYLEDIQNTKFNQGLSSQEMQLKIDEAKRKNYQIVEGNDGTVLAINPNDPTDVKTIGNYAKPQPTNSGGAGGRYPAGDPMSSAAMRAYYQAYGQLPSESLIPYYSDLYANESTPQFGTPSDGTYGPAFLGYSNPFATGASTLDSRYGRGAAGADNPYASGGKTPASSLGGYYDQNGVWIEG